MTVQKAVKFYDSSLVDLHYWFSEQCGKFHQLIGTSESRLNAPIYIFLENTPYEAFEDPEVMDLIEEACKSVGVRLELHIQWGLAVSQAIYIGYKNERLIQVFIATEEYCMAYTPLPVPGENQRVAIR